MNPDAPQNPREELKVRLTALLLGELPDHEAGAVRQAIAADPELAALYGRLKETIELVRETAASPAGETASQPEPLKLSEERRETLLAKFKTVTPKEFVAPRRREIPWYVPMSIAALLVAMIGLAVLMPGAFRSREEERVMAVQNMNRLLDGELREIDQGVPLGLVSPTPPSISSEVAAQDGFNARYAPSASSSEVRRAGSR